MSAIKETTGNSASVQNAENLNRAARKSAEMSAGHALITATAKQLVKEKKQLKEELKSQENRPKDKTRDMPELSKLSKWFGIEGRQLEAADLKWILEMEWELWDAFLNWIPTLDASLSEHMKELSNLYLSLLEAVLTHTAGEEQVIQLERLNTVLAQKLNLLMNTDLKDLIQFLNKTGDEKAVSGVKSSLYKQTTGENLSPGEAGKFFAHGVKAAGDGTLYQPLKRGGIQIDQAYDTHAKSPEVQLKQRSTSIHAGTTSERNAIAAGKGVTLFSGKELEAANSFSRHLNQSENLFADNEFSKQSDELIGFLSAVTTIKERIFTSSVGTDSRIRLPMKNVVNQMIDHYLSRKGALKVYYHMTDTYDQTGNPQKAVEEGLDYAYKSFLEKKQNPAYNNKTYYSEEAGFFQMLKNGQTLAEELRIGLRLLEENWKDFLKSIHLEDRESLYLTLQKYSPWGAVLKQKKEKLPIKLEKDKLLAVCVIAGVLIGLLFYFAIPH